MSGITISIEGDTLKRLKEIGTNAVNKVLLDGERNIKLGCPVKTGAARNSIKADLVARTISSDCEYMGPLNNGHSKQAPAGFWEAGMAQALRAINS